MINVYFITFKPIFTFIDVWGNSKRDMIDTEKASLKIQEIITDDVEAKKKVNVALEYVKELSWDVPVGQLVNKINEVLKD